MTIHRLNAYKDGHIWITYCELCGKEADELLGSKCTGKVEAVEYEDNRLKIKNGVEPIKSLIGGGYWLDDDGKAHSFKNAVDKPTIDDYVTRLIADNGN